MGLFSKLKKGLKSIVKSVSKGIKKVAKGIGKVMGKIAKPFAKFGILGQIALSFIMPWAVGGIMKGMGYLASSSFGTFAGKLAADGNLFIKAAGKLAQGINYGAAAVNKAYTFVSDGISRGLDWVGQQGVKLKKGITNTFDGAKEWIMGPADALPVTAPSVSDLADFESMGIDKLNLEKSAASAIETTAVAPPVVKYGDALNAAEKAKYASSLPEANLLSQHGKKLISGGTEAAKKVFTVDTAKNEIVKAADAQTAASTPSYEEGPTVSYLEQPLSKISQDYDFSIKAAGGQYMSPLDSALIMEQYKYI